MSILHSRFGRYMLMLLLLALAIQLLEIGLEKLFLLPDVPMIEVAQQTQPLGLNKSVAGIERITDRPAAESITTFYRHSALGFFTALALGMLTASGLIWWRRAPWWLVLLVLLIAIALTRLGVQTALKPLLLFPLKHLDSSLSLVVRFQIIGTLGISSFLLLTWVAARALPHYSRAQAASVPGPRSSE
jgi:hypothetical protein